MQQTKIPSFSLSPSVLIYGKLHWILYLLIFKTAETKLHIKASTQGLELLILKKQFLCKNTFSKCSPPLRPSPHKHSKTAKVIFTFILPTR